MDAIWLDLGASIGTAIGVAVAAWQIWRSASQARTDFEDELVREYRGITRLIPTPAHLGKTLSDEEHLAALPAMYAYVDLANQQVFLRMNGRIRTTTWDDWAEGIQGKLVQPAFKRAWEEIRDATPGSFKELQRLEAEKFKPDPHAWMPWDKRIDRWIGRRRRRSAATP